MAIKLISKNLFKKEKMKSSESFDKLLGVLDTAIELLQLSGNDFSWSGWETSEEAVTELRELQDILRMRALPIHRYDIALLFAPTGPLQEVSLSSGWATSFLKLVKKYDQVEKQLWVKA